MIRILLAVSIALLTVSCSSIPHKKSPAPALQKLTQAGIPAATMKRIAAGRVLGYDDIVQLVNTHIPSRVITAYLKSTHAAYQLTNKQLNHLVSIGASPSLVNYLGKSTGYFEASKRNQTGGDKWGNHPYFNDPAYWGLAPFPYMYPAEWYDPAAVGLWF